MKTGSWMSGSLATSSRRYPGGRTKDFKASLGAQDRRRLGRRLQCGRPVAPGLLAVGGETRGDRGGEKHRDESFHGVLLGLLILLRLNQVLAHQMRGPSRPPGPEWLDKSASAFQRPGAGRAVDRRSGGAVRRTSPRSSRPRTPGSDFRTPHPPRRGSECPRRETPAGSSHAANIPLTASEIGASCSAVARSAAILAMLTSSVRRASNI